MKSLVCSITLFFSALSLNASVSLFISGGDTTPLTVTIPQDIVFNNVTGAPIPLYGFVIIGVLSGNFSDITAQHSGTAGWNGTGTNSSTGPMGSTSSGDVTLNDLLVTWQFGDAPNLTGTMTLTAGFRTTSAPLGIVYPQGTGSYEVRMLDSGNTIVGDPGFVTAVPEPGTYAALIGLAALGLVAYRRRHA